MRVVQVFCRRVERHLDVEEHARCPYCNGDEDRIRTARHESFCDYQPGADPTCFGFPEDRGRYRR
jgi:hypothetical protein